MEAPLSAQRREGSRIQPSRDGRAFSRARPGAWYQRALGGLLLCRQPAAVEAPAPAVLARERAERGRTPLWRSTLKAAVSALARVCKPVFSGVHAESLAPTRRGIRSGGRSLPVAAPAVSMPAGEWENWRCAFVGMPLNDDELMRRFVLKEEYATRRRMQMQEAAKRSGRCWFPPGPSRLCEMSLAAVAVSEDDEAGESSSTSTSPQRSEAQSL